jgi:hypothetical protein
MSIFCTVDDKHVPLYRIVWISQLPHFCGSPDCQHEGEYELHLDSGESVWGDLQERDAALEAVEAWQSGREP